MTWELKHVEDTERIEDDSGVYVVISRITTVPNDHRPDDYPASIEVRADLLATDDIEPIISFYGSANAVRKHLIRFMFTCRYDRYDMAGDTLPKISLEHASYIGYELLQAEIDSHYVQD